MATVSPDQASSRILTLDVIRGVAVMGIFSVNVVAFAMIEAAYFHPPTYGWNGLADRLMWLGNFIFIDGKMRSLFSMLFGASMLLVAERAEAAGLSAISVHYRRMIVLLVFGLAHFYLLWFGDILATYAVVGMAAFLFWRLDAIGLAAMSACAYVLAFIFSCLNASLLYDAANLLRTGEGTLEQIAGARGMISFLAPGPQDIAADFAAHRSLAAFIAQQTGPKLWDPLNVLQALWPETLALMLLGMAAYRSGFLTGTWPREMYRHIAVACIAIGAAGSAALAAFVWSTGFAIPWTMIALETLSMPLHPVMAVGYAALITLLIHKRGALTLRFAAVGRAAFTNYLGTSLLATFIFNGWGLGLYGKLSRAEAWLLAPAFWLLMLLWSKPWLDRFRYGPFEWAWRSLSRGKLQPMRKALPAA